MSRHVESLFVIRVQIEFGCVFVGNIARSTYPHLRVRARIHIPHPEQRLAVYTMRSRGRFFRASLKGLALVSLVAGGFQCVSAGRDEAAGDDGCDIDPLLRPVILIHGFRRTFLYNSSANYEIAGVDNEDVAPGSDGRGGSELDLPLTWDPENAIQDMTDVGPERFDGDDTPGLFLLNGTLVPLLNTV